MSVLRNLPTLNVLIALCTALLVAAIWTSRSSAVASANTESNASNYSSDASDADDLSEGDLLIAEAIKRLEQAPSVVAQIKHESHMFGQLLVGDGLYQQLNHPDGVMTRLELSVQTDNEVTTLRHISNGQFLYMQEQQGNEQRVRRVDLRTVRRNQSSTMSGKLASHSREVAPAAPPTSMTHSIAIGGLPRLLAELQKNFTFRKPQAISFQDVPVWAVAGEWKADRLQLLLPSEKGLTRSDGTVNREKIPAYIPDRVFVLIGRDRLFPYRLEYRKDSMSVNVAKPVALSASGSDALLTMDLYRVHIGKHPDLEIREFWYQHDDHQKLEDYTSRFIKSLR